MKGGRDEWIRPIEFPKKFKNLVDGLLGENVKDEVVYKQFDGCTLLFFTGGTFRRVALKPHVK